MTKPKFVQINDTVGKTIKGVYQSIVDRDCHILFTDGTFTCLTAEYTDDIVDLVCWASEDPNNYLNGLGIELGFWTPETLAAAKEELAKRERELTREERRRRYEELKWEFEREGRSDS